MEILEEHSLEKNHSNDPSFRLVRRQELQQKIKDYYKLKYDRLEHNSIKYLELQSYHRKPSIEGFSLLKAHQPKNRVITHLQRNHVTLKACRHIIDLPKSPWGCHKSYNDQSHFVDNHISSPDNRDSSQINKFTKKQKLFEKVVRKTKKNTAGKEMNSRGKNIVFQTNSGKLYCKRYPQAESMYEVVNQRSVKAREAYGELTDKINEMLEQKAIKPRISVSSSAITKRLYTPPPIIETSNHLIDKYKSLWTEISTDI
jgi:hypothetical protein